MSASIFQGQPPSQNASVNGTVLEQRFVATAAQTVFTLTKYTYTPGTGSIFVYSGGALKTLESGFYTETSTSSITLAVGATVGTEIVIIGYPQMLLTYDPRVDFADATSATKGAALVGYNNSLTYPASTVGNKLNTLDSGLTATNATVATLASSVASITSAAIGGSSSGLIISTTGTSSIITVTADEIVLESSAGTYAVARNVYETVDFSASGIDTPPVAANTWYAIYAAYDPVNNQFRCAARVVHADTGTTSIGSPVITGLTNPTPSLGIEVGSKLYMPGLAAPYGTVLGLIGTTGVTLNVPATANAAGVALSTITKPYLGANYTHFAFLGMVKTDGSGNKYPLSMLQIGKRAELVLAGNVTAFPQFISGIQGNIGVPTWVGTVVKGAGLPINTTKGIFVLGHAVAGTVAIAPNNASGVYNSTTNPPPFNFALAAASMEMSPEFLLPSTSVYYYSDTANSFAAVRGWELP